MTFNERFNNLSQTEFDFLLKNGRRSSILLGHDFEALIYSSWKFLKETLPDLVKKGKFEELIYSCFIDRNIYIFKNDVEACPVNELMSFLLWLVDERESISKMEQEHLKSEPDTDLQAAGINEMEKFGDTNTVDSLADGDITKYDAIKAQPYHVIFDKLLMQLTQRKIEKKLIKLKQPKKGGRS